MISLVTHHVWHTDWQNIWWTVIHCRMTSIRMIRWQVPIVHIWAGCGFFFNGALTLTSFFLMFDMKFKGPVEVIGDKIWLMSEEGEEGRSFLCFLLYPWVGSCNSASDSLLKIINANCSTHTHNSRIINQHVQPATQNWLQKSLQTPQKPTSKSEGTSDKVTHDPTPMSGIYLLCTDQSFTWHHREIPLFPHERGWLWAHEDTLEEEEGGDNLHFWDCPAKTLVWISLFGWDR